MANQSGGTTDYRLEEWKECRSTVARFDKSLVEIRKYGFTLVTGLLTANSYLFVKVDELTPMQMMGISLIMIFLIIGLFVLDRYYLVLVRAAVKRAKYIESKKVPIMKLSTQIQVSVTQVSAHTLIIGLYCSFILVSLIPLLIQICTYIFSKSLYQFVFIIVWFSLLIIFNGFIIFYNTILRSRTKLDLS
jgi:hypothetical protein